VSPAPHTPVLLAEVVAALAPRAGSIIVDGTFGAGGYSKAFLEAAPCRVFGIDRDPDQVARAAEIEGRFEDRLTVLEGRFGTMDGLLAARGVTQVDGIALDLGVSSMQLDQAERGFSFRHEGPLDMRMEKAGPSAADAVNTLPEAELADIIWRLGDERHSRRVARAIVAARKTAPFTTTHGLAEVVRAAVPRSKDAIDPATRTFQALRIHVNDELGELDRGLGAAERLLRAGGRLAVVSFHSLEDRAVKDFLRNRSAADARPSRHLPPAAAGQAPSFSLVGKKPVSPTDSDIAANPRARSARLRVAERTSAPAWSTTAPAWNAQGGHA
jgi:16S rRNA (cytosine1402-N4)-methyltransferase